MKTRTFLAASVARFASLISSPGGGGLLCLFLCAGVAIQASAQTLPEATFAAATSSVNEDDGTEDGHETVAVTVNLSSAPSQDIVITYNTGSGTDTASRSLSNFDDEGDYRVANPHSTLGHGSVTLPSGATSVDIVIEAVEDDRPEGDETLLVTLESGEFYNAGSANTHTITIIDNDYAEVTFSPLAVMGQDSSWVASMDEDVGTINVAVELNTWDEGRDLCVGYTVTGTATFGPDAAALTANEDFGITDPMNTTPPCAKVQVLSFSQYGYIDIVINDDDTKEEDETVILTLVDGEGYTVGPADRSAITITIEDNADVGVAKPTITISTLFDVANVPLVEASAVTIDVSASQPPAADLDVTLTVAADAAGSDFLDPSQAGDQTVTIKAGKSDTTFVLTALSMNQVYSEPGTITVTIKAGADYVVGKSSSITLNVEDLEPPPPALVVSFASDSTTIREPNEKADEDYVDIVVNINPASSEPLMISYGIVDILAGDRVTTATSGDYDIMPANGTVRVDAGESTFTLEIEVHADIIAEGDETVVLEIQADPEEDNAAYRVGANSRHTVTIEDDEVTASFASASTVVDEGGMAEVTVNLDKEVPDDKRIEITYGVTYKHDQAPETIPCYDKGCPDAQPTPVIGIPGSSDVVILDRGLLRGVGFADGMKTTTATIMVDIQEDAIPEGDETLTLTLMGGVVEDRMEGDPYYAHYVDAANSQHTITIRASDGGTSTTVVAPAASFASASATAAESAGTQNVAISLNPAPSAAITLNYTLSGTATRGADYTISGVTSNNGTVNVNAGATSVNIPVAITDDSADEPNETVIITLASGTGYDLGSAAAYTLTITDNDGGSTTTTPPVTTPPVTTPPVTTAASVALSASPNPVAEGDSVTITVTPSRLVSGDVTVPLVLTAGTAEAEDYSALASIVIEGNEPNGTGVIRARKDVDMDDETFTVSLGTLPSSVVAGTPASVEITIMDVGIVSAEADGQELPDAFALEQNYPNPFNPSTAIEYALPEAAHVLIEVFDATGRSAGVLVDGVRPAGRHSARFEASSLPSGLYVYRMSAGGQTMVRKMTLVR